MSLMFLSGYLGHIVQMYRETGYLPCLSIEEWHVKIRKYFPLEEL